MIFTNWGLKWSEALKMLYYAACGDGSVYITCFRIYWPTRQHKKYSLIIGCNNFITNQKLSGEFLHPRPTKFVKGFFKVFKTLWKLGRVLIYHVNFMSSTYLLNDFISKFLYSELAVEHDSSARSFWLFKGSPWLMREDLSIIRNHIVFEDWK